jgi:putative endonuclease
VTQLNSSIFGRAGEKQAQAFLKGRGWSIIAEDYGTSGGEIDIVAYKRGILAFVEVKTRSNTEFGTPAEAVDSVKQSKLSTAAKGFVREQMSGGRIPVYSRLFKKQRFKRVKITRFDIIEVYMSKSFVMENINYIENAF